MFDKMFLLFGIAKMIPALILPIAASAGIAWFRYDSKADGYREARTEVLEEINAGNAAARERAEVRAGRAEARDAENRDATAEMNRQADEFRATITALEADSRCTLEGIEWPWEKP